MCGLEGFSRGNTSTIARRSKNVTNCCVQWNPDITICRRITNELKSRDFSTLIYLWRPIKRKKFHFPAIGYIRVLLYNCFLHIAAFGWNAGQRIPAGHRIQYPQRTDQTAEYPAFHCQYSHWKIYQVSIPLDVPFPISLIQTLDDEKNYAEKM